MVRGWGGSRKTGHTEGTVAVGQGYWNGMFRHLVRSSHQSSLTFSILVLSWPVCCWLRFIEANCPWTQSAWTLRKLLSQILQSFQKRWCLRTTTLSSADRVSSYYLRTPSGTVTIVCSHDSSLTILSECKGATVGCSHLTFPLEISELGVLEEFTKTSFIGS